MKKERFRREQTLGEEIGNSITHGVGVIFAISSLVLMLFKANTTKEYISVIIFNFGFLMLYLSSCLYHSFKQGSKVKKVFRVFDHTCIYILIGSTYAPILMLVIGGLTGLIFFIVQWLIILTAIMLRIFAPSKSTLLQTILSVVLGWSGLIFLVDMYHFSNMLFYMILFGGISYSLGIIFYALGHKIKYGHFIWHFFVLGGTILHFIGIYLYIL